MGRPDLYSTTTFAPTAGTLLSFAVAGPTFTFRLQNPSYSQEPSLPPQSDYLVAFGPNSRLSDPARTNARYTTYQNYNPDIRTLQQFNPGQANDLLTLDYAGMGIFTLEHSLTPLVHQDVRPYAFFSQNTPVSGLPSGTVMYSGVIAGFATPKNGQVTDATTPPAYAYNIGGTVRITVDFTARTFSGTLSFNAVSDQGGRPAFNLGDVALVQGTLSEASLSAMLNEGSLLAMLAGPNGQELGGSLLLTIADTTQGNIPLSLVAAFVAKR